MNISETAKTVESLLRLLQANTFNLYSAMDMMNRMVEKRMITWEQIKRIDNEKFGNVLGSRIEKTSYVQSMKAQS